MWQDIAEKEPSLHAEVEGEAKGTLGVGVVHHRHQPQRHVRAHELLLQGNSNHTLRATLHVHGARPEAVDRAQRTGCSTMHQIDVALGAHIQLQK